MKAVTWQGKRNLSVEEVPDPVIQNATDAIIKVTSSGLCGSDLHLYEVMTPFMTKGDILGHEPMGIVQEVGSAVTAVKVGDRVVIPFNIACGECRNCQRGLTTQCETTQVRSQGRGAALFGYTKLYGQVPGGQAEYLRVPYANYMCKLVPKGPKDDRFLFLSDVLPTAWQAVKYAAVPKEGTLVVLGLGPIGDMATRVAKQQGVQTVIGVDLVPERLERAKRHGVHVLDWNEFQKDTSKLQEAINDITHDHGADSVIDAVGMEAHGSPSVKTIQTLTGMLPNTAAEKLFTTAGVDRMNAIHTAIDIVARGGTISLSGVYAGQADPISIDTLFDKQITVRMGQANAPFLTNEILPLLTEADTFGVDEFATHHLKLEDAAHAYDIFQNKTDGAFKIVFQP